MQTYMQLTIISLNHFLFLFILPWSVTSPFTYTEPEVSLILSPSVSAGLLLLNVP